MRGDDYYAILNVNKDVKEEEVRRSYKRLAMIYHPDKNPSNPKESEEKFKQISEAYQVLGNANKRKLYDLLHGVDGLKADHNVPSPPYSTPKRTKPNPSPSPSPSASLPYKFNPKSTAEGGVLLKVPSCEHEIVFSLEDLYTGTTKRMKTEGRIYDVTRNLKLMNLKYINRRPRVMGYNFGPMIEMPEEKITIQVMPRMKNGTKIPLVEKGATVDGYKVRGDLVIIVVEKPHDIYKREGDDLVIIQHISLSEALTGVTLNVTTLDGRLLMVPITDIITPGDEVEVPDEGMPILTEPGKKGKLRIKLVVDFPISLTKEQISDSGIYSGILRDEKDVCVISYSGKITPVATSYHELQGIRRWLNQI
ncbi:hypothetical protein GIB67_038433 [Kingdonia uniflora]|uniref:J domain-containing protein n=1 Tax=Kingdonia uniflora TaxID=39325 RepID=A0A7J7NP42_9MAGN|nr:hypothetical protein GIB67_038433 [Kingdonia uniflora]